MKKTDVVPAVCLTLILSCSIVLTGFFIPFDSEDATVNGVDIDFKDSSNISCDGETGVAGCAVIGGSEMRLSNGLGVLGVYFTCNHEMLHVNGLRHEDFGVVERFDLRFFEVCGELVF